MWPVIPSYTRGEKTLVIILRIYEDIAIFLIFCYHQYTESESREIGNDVAVPIFIRIAILYKMEVRSSGDYSSLWI